MPAPFVGLGHSEAVFLGEGLIVEGSQRELAGERIEHRLQEAFERGQLRGRQLIDKGMHVVAGVSVHIRLLYLGRYSAARRPKSGVSKNALMVFSNTDC